MFFSVFTVHACFCHYADEMVLRNEETVEWGFLPLSLTVNINEPSWILLLLEPAQERCVVTTRPGRLQMSHFFIYM